jgi:hypothetical protein
MIAILLVDSDMDDATVKYRFTNRAIAKASRSSPVGNRYKAFSLACHFAFRRTGNEESRRQTVTD